MKNFSLPLLCLLTVFYSPSILAQGENNIYSFTFKKLGDQIELSRPKFLNGFNKNSYNNQPYFKDAKSMYLSCKMSDTQETDIIRLNLYTRSKAQVTQTPEAEYSPRLRPGTVAFNCVRVESDGTSQRLWQFPTNQSSQGKPLFPDTKNVGYYHWLDSDRVALFLVGEPHSLAIGNAADGTVSNMTSNIGRGMDTAPDGDLLYIQKLSESTWYIKKMNPNTGKSYIVIETLDQSEDFLVIDDVILMAQGAKLFTCPVSGETLWTEVADLSAYGLQKITRLAFNGDRVLVLVDSQS